MKVPSHSPWSAPVRPLRVALIICVVLTVWCGTLGIAEEGAGTGSNTSGTLQRSDSTASSKTLSESGEDSAASSTTSTMIVSTTRPPSASTTLSTGAWVGIGFAAGVVLAGLVAGLALMLARWWNCCCFAHPRSSPTPRISPTPSTTSHHSSSRSSRRSFLSRSPSQSSSTSSTRRARVPASDTRRETVAKDLTDVSSKADSVGSVEGVDDTPNAFRQFAMAPPATVDRPGLEKSVTHSQCTVVHAMRPGSYHPNPFSPATLTVLSSPPSTPTSVASRTPSPYTFVATPEVPQPLVPARPQEPEVFYPQRMLWTGRSPRPLRRRSSSVSFVDIND